MDNKLNNILAWFVKVGLLAVPVLPLVVTRSLFFPFITGRNFIFRILIEVLFVFWLWLVMSEPKYRPRFSVIMFSVFGVILVLFLATVFSISPYKSFWSSFERMEGFWGHWHYFLYFLMLGSVFQSREEWKKFFLVSVGASAIVTFYGLFQFLGQLDVHQGDTRLDATMGNATYLAIYLVFHVFLLFYFFVNLKDKNIWLRLLLLILVVLELFIVYRTATRGAMLGFLGGLGVFSLVNLLWNSGKARRWAAVFLVVVIAIPVLFLIFKDTQFVKQNEVLSRFASISLKETTTQSRFIIWRMAFEAWQDRPVLGWGPESFVYIFSKYFDPQLWRQEPWFDRAHNVFLDWLTSAGAVGLAAYLTLFASGFWALRRLFKRGEMDALTLGLFCGLLTAYMVHNIFVFDNFTSYIIFFALLAFWHGWYIESSPAKPSGSIPLPIIVRTPVLAAVALATIFSVYVFNVKPIWASQSIIDALSLVTYSQDGVRVRDLGEGLKALKRGIDYNTFGTAEIREQLAQYAERINNDPATSDQDKQRFIDFALEQMKIQAESSPYDLRAKAFLTALYTESSQPDQAILAAQEALSVSDKRQQFYFLLAEAYFKAGEENLAVEMARRAYELAPEYPDAIHNYAMTLIFSGQPRVAEDLLEKHFGARIYPDPRYVNAYAALHDFNKMVIIWEKLVGQSPANVQYRVSLASVYLKVFRDKEAVGQIEQAIELNPIFKSQGNILIEQIKSGKVVR